MDGLNADLHKRHIELEYLNAALQRSKKLPKLKTLTGDPNRGPSLKEVMERIEQAPTFEKVE